MLQRMPIRSYPLTAATTTRNMLTFVNHPPILDRLRGIIEIWDDDKQAYEGHTFEFIDSLHDMIHEQGKFEPADYTK